MARQKIDFDEPEPGVISTGDFKFGTLSTGSTLLDLCIAGKRCEDGGIPGGIILEVYGPPGSGKTAILSEICSSSQRKGGKVQFMDPEARLDSEYARIYGVKLEAENYSRPNTVSEVFGLVFGWEPDNPLKSDNTSRFCKAINVIATDSLAALSTDIELEKGDKMGMRRAKEFSEGLRKTARIIRNNNWVIACSNQVREGDYGETTPGGHAIPYYASLRIRVGQVGKIERKAKLPSGKEVKKVIGIESECYVKKSTIDDPYRACSIFIEFGHGISDIMGNLQYIKDTYGNSMYECPDNKKYQGVDQAIIHVEELNLQTQLRQLTIKTWREIEEKFNRPRAPKIRW